MKNITRESIIEDTKEAAKQVAGPLSRSDFERITGIRTYHIYKMFPDGGWSEVTKLAGLERSPQGIPLSDDDILREYYRVSSIIGDIPTWHVFSDKAAISADVVRRRFGGTEGTKK